MSDRQALIERLEAAVQPGMTSVTHRRMLREASYYLQRPPPRDELIGYLEAYAHVGPFTETQKIRLRLIIGDPS